MAIEDALVLAATLATESDIEAAFARFFELRHERTQTVIKIGRLAGSQKHAPRRALAVLTARGEPGSRR